MAGSSNTHSSPKHTTGSVSSQRRAVGNSRKPPQFPHRLSHRASNRLCRVRLERRNSVRGAGPAELKRFVLIRLSMLFLCTRFALGAGAQQPKQGVSVQSVMAAAISAADARLVKALRADRAAARTYQLIHAAAALPRSDFIFQFELTRRSPLRRNPGFLPAIRFDRRRLRLVPGKHAMRSGTLAQTHGLRAGEPLF